MAERDQKAPRPSDFPLPPQWESLVPLPTQKAVVSLANWGTNAAVAGLQCAAADGLERAKASMGADQMMWAVASRLSSISTKWNRGNNTQNPLPSPTVRMDELTWSVACEFFTDGWPEHEKHAELCEVSFNTEYERDNAAVHAFVHSRFGRELGLDPEAVEEIVQVVWLGVLTAYWSREAACRFEALSTLRTLLCTAAKHEAWKRLKKQRLDASYRDGSAHDLAADRQSEQLLHRALESAEIRDQIERLLPQLPPLQQQVCEMRLVRMMSNAQVAKFMNSSESNISRAFKQGCTQLQTWLDERSDDDPGHAGHRRKP